jgi:hypothetical protein
MKAKIVFMMLALGVGCAARADLAELGQAIDNLDKKLKPAYIDAKIIAPLKDAAANKSPVMGLHAAGQSIKELRDLIKDINVVSGTINNIDKPAFIPSALKAIKFPVLAKGISKTNDALEKTATLITKFNLVTGSGELYSEKQYKELQNKLSSLEKELAELKKTHEACAEELKLLKDIQEHK